MDHCIKHGYMMNYGHPNMYCIQCFLTARQYKNIKLLLNTIGKHRQREPNVMFKREWCIWCVLCVMESLFYNVK